MVSWQFLLIGSVGAVGAALAVGTLAALANYRRSGRFPGQSEDDPAVELTTKARVGMYVRVAIGLAIAVWAVASLLTSGLI